MKYDFTSVGEILIDFTPAGRSGTGAVLFQQNMGGAPGNVACAISKLGRRSAFIGMAGDDGFGRFCKESLEAQGVDTAGMILSPDENTTLSFVHLSDSGDRSFSFYRRHSADVKLKISDLNMNIIRDSRIFHFGGVSLSDDPARSATVYAVGEAKKHGAIITYDPNIRMNLWKDTAELKSVTLDAFQYADIVKLSDDEAAFLFDTDNCISVIERIKAKYGAKLVLVSRGARGALTAADGRPYESPAFDVKTIDTTGSGDCFFAGALHCLLTYNKPADRLGGDEIDYLLAFANASGSLASTRMGAVSALPTASEIERCMCDEKPLLFD